MSTGFVGHSSAMPPNGNGVLQIVHYDATVRRTEKMRQKATQGTAPAAAPAPVAVQPAPAPVAVQPVAPQPVAPQPVAAPAPATMNGIHAAPAPAAKPLPKIDIAELETFLVNFVVEQTGYPPEMVELDADLEADLGIDSIKKAQLFGEMAEHLDIKVEVSEDMSLDDFPTLRHVTDFLQKAASGAAAPTAAAPAPAPAPVAAAPVAHAPTPVAQSAPATPAPAAAAAVANLNLAELEPFLINFVVEQTGYPPEMVELDADLEADLGIDSIKKAQLFGELAEHLDVKVEISDDMSLDDFPTLRHVMDFLKNAASGAGQPAPAAAPQPAPAAAPVAASPMAVQTMAAQPAAPAPATQPAPAAAPASNGKQSAGDLSPVELEQFLVNFVVEQTGYPPEMVELDADLEADLGIDSIKKAQLFGELAENLDAKVEVSEDMSLDDFPTLRHVMDFLVSGKKPASV